MHEKCFSKGNNLIFLKKHKISLLTCIGITMTIHWSSCYHSYITYIIFTTGIALWLLTMHNAIVVRKHLDSLFHRAPVVFVVFDFKSITFSILLSTICFDRSTWISHISSHFVFLFRTCKDINY